MTEQLELRFMADSADDAVRQAKAWAKAEPNLRLRTIARVRQAEGAGWIVTLAVTWLDRVPA